MKQKDDRKVFEQIPVANKRPYRISPFQLKTIKDMEGRSVCELRDEAIEWVLELERAAATGENNKDCKKKPTPGIGPEFMTPGQMRALGQIWIMKHFFNIKEDDLQNHVFKKQGIGIHNYGE